MGNALCKLRPKHECKLTISRVGHRKMTENFVVPIWGVRVKCMYRIMPCVKNMYKKKISTCVV